MRDHALVHRVEGPHGQDERLEHPVVFVVGVVVPVELDAADAPEAVRWVSERERFGGGTEDARHGGSGSVRRRSKRVSATG